MKTASLYQPVPSQRRFLFNKVITWGDASTELVQIDTDGWFYLNGVKRKLIGMCDSFIYDSGDWWDAGNVAILSKELTYLQGKGVRLYAPNMGASDVSYAPILQTLYDHKMLVVPLFCNTGMDNFDSLTTTDFVIGEGTVSSYLATWLTAMGTFDNIVALTIENEIDVSAGHTYTLANAILYMDLLFNYVRANSTLPLITKFGYLDNSAFATTAQNQFLSYSDIPCFDLYHATAADFTADCIETQRWYKNKNSKLSQMWITETNYIDGDGYDATALTKAMVDALLAYSSAVFLFAVQCKTEPTAMFFDAAGDQIANLDTLLANVATWQAAI